MRYRARQVPFNRRTPGSAQQASHPLNSRGTVQYSQSIIGQGRRVRPQTGGDRAWPPGFGVRRRRPGGARAKGTAR
eukprot:34012-Eustigmatos_ZCMA.PRE.1